MNEASASEFKEFEARGWTAQATTYGQLSGAITRRLAEPLLDAAGLEHGQRVLDLATGPGYVAELAAARGAPPVGLDISEGMLEEARRRLPSLEFVAGDAEDLPFEDRTFDVVVGGFIVNHLPRPERGLHEAVRVLVPGGRVAFSVWDGPQGMPVMGLVGKAIAAVGVEEDEEKAGIPAGPDPFRFANPAEFRALLEGAGLVEVGVESVGLVHQLADAEQLWEGFLGGSVRAATVVRAQPGSVQARIREALDHVVAPYRVGQALELRVAARIASGRKR